MRTNQLTRVNHVTGQVTSWEPPNGRNNITKVTDAAGRTASSSRFVSVY